MARILLIDDDPTIRSLAIAILERNGDHVVTATDGRTGMTAFQAEPFDLVVTDIVMPGQEGLATITEIRRQNWTCPILAMSGSSTVGRYGDYLDAAALTGATATLAKPFTADAFMEKVDLLLRR